MKIMIDMENHIIIYLEDFRKKAFELKKMIKKHMNIIKKDANHYIIFMIVL